MTSARDFQSGTWTCTIVMGALAGATAGAVEFLNLLRKSDVRAASWGAETLGVALLLYAVAGAVLVLPAWALARLLLGSRAPAGPAAVLGTIGGFAVFLACHSHSAGALLLCVLAATVAAVILLPVRTRLPRGQSARLWWGLMLAPALLALAVLSWQHAQGSLRLSTLALTGVAAVALVTAAGSRRAAGALLVASVLGAAAGAALAAFPYAGSAVPLSPEPGAPPSVVLISVDTLRADHLGCYGDSRARTPVMDALAREGVCFENATSQANTTGPSHVTMLTGLYPPEHGALSNGWPLGPQARTLPELLRPAGYTSAAFVSGFTLVDRACGLASRFDWYDDELLAWTFLPQLVDHLRLVQYGIDVASHRGHDVERPDRPAGETVDRALHWLRHRPGKERPFFLFVHLYDPHAPYTPPPPFDRLFAEGEKSSASVGWYRLPPEQRREIVDDPTALARQRDLYSGEIAFADQEVGRLLAALKEQDLLSRTLVVLTSDHGEGLGSHDYFFDHGTYLYDEELHVPLILRFPDGRGAGTRVQPQARLLDLTPTVLDVLGVEPPDTLRGQSLLPLVGHPELAPELPSFALSELSGLAATGERQSLRVAGKKLIRNSERWLDSRRVPVSFELYDLHTDPEEQRNLLAGSETPAELAALREQLENWHSALEHLSGRGQLSEEMLELLRKLGYL